jgi:hypothetical protein
MDKQSSGSEGTSKEPETGLHIIRPQDESFNYLGRRRLQWSETGAETAMDDPDTHARVRIHHLLLGILDMEVTVAD